MRAQGTPSTTRIEWSKVCFRRGCAGTRPIILRRRTVYIFALRCTVNGVFIRIELCIYSLCVVSIALCIAVYCSAAKGNAHSGAKTAVAALPMERNMYATTPQRICGVVVVFGESGF